MYGSAPTSQMGGAGPLGGGAYRGGVQAGPEGAGACWPRLIQEAGATRQAGWSSGAWPQGERWVRRRGQRQQAGKTASAGLQNTSDERLSGFPPVCAFF